MDEIILNEYDYDLPEERIAQHPVPERDDSKLLVFKKGIITEDRFSNITNILPASSLLVFNNTKVVKARLRFLKKSGAAIEVFCLEPLLPYEYEQSFGSKFPVEWKCLVGNLKKWKHEILKASYNINGNQYVLSAEDLGEMNEVRRIRFSWDDQDICFGEVLESAGHIPLPPYINRDDSEEDVVRYQTVYSSVRGSVAAPTAGLHFTVALMKKLSDHGIRHTELTLHVGAGTFQPVRSDLISEHEMHTEHFFVSAGTIEILLKTIGNIIAVGTTTCRTLESLYWLGVKIKTEGLRIRDHIQVDQWEPYQNDPGISVQESLTLILDQMKINRRSILNASTRLIIIPGYQFRMMDALITNFHQPKSTLLLLVSAWTGEEWKRIYNYAIENEFRFLSYGDSSLLFR